MKMKKTIVVLIVLVVSLAAGLSHAADARIKIDIDRTVGQINKNLYGNFVEHLGR